MLFCPTNCNPAPIMCPCWGGSEDAEVKRQRRGPLPRALCLGARRTAPVGTQDECGERLQRENRGTCFTLVVGRPLGRESKA